MSSDKKKWNKTEKDRKNMEKWLSENKIPDLNSLKLFQFEPKTNIGDITVVAVMMRKNVLNIE